MLHLTRKAGESVLINHNIKITVIDIKGKSVRLGFVFPPEIRVFREEIVRRMQQEKKNSQENGVAHESL